MNTHGLLRCTLSELQGATVVRPIGRLDVRTYPQLRDTLLKCAADQPRAVIVDADALEIAGDHLISVFVAVWMRMSQWSPVQLTVIPGQANAVLFHHSAAQRFLTVHPSVSAALERLDETPRRCGTVLCLPPSHRSVRAAQRFVTETCRNWDIATLTADAVAVATELVANAALHAESPARLRLESWPGRLTVAVADDAPQLVELPRLTGQHAEGDRGLRLVARLAQVCGCSPAQSGGKVVWAVLRTPPDQ